MRTLLTAAAALALGGLGCATGGCPTAQGVVLYHGQDAELCADVYFNDGTVQTVCAEPERFKRGTTAWR